MGKIQISLEPKLKRNHPEGFKEKATFALDPTQGFA